MPKSGDTINGREIGRSSQIYIWRICEDCGQGKWILRTRGDRTNAKICKLCSMRRLSQRNKLEGTLKGDKHPRWAGGRTKRADGYIEIWVADDDFFYPMTYGFNSDGKSRRNYVPEHRLIMARYLNRCLLPWEIVHHKNGIRDDNRLENLELLSTTTRHLPDMVIKAYIRRLQKRMETLENENKSLKQKLACPLKKDNCIGCRYIKDIFCDWPYRNNMTEQEIKWETKRRISF